MPRTRVTVWGGQQGKTEGRCLRLLHRSPRRVLTSQFQRWRDAKDSFPVKSQSSCRFRHLERPLPLGQLRAKNRPFASKSAGLNLCSCSTSMKFNQKHSRKCAYFIRVSCSTSLGAFEDCWLKIFILLCRLPSCSNVFDMALCFESR